jgi:glycosyltransferase involved in cell wall biosynthesis
MEDGMRLLALVDSPDHVCCRYRIRAFEPALKQAGWTLTCERLEPGAIFRVPQLKSAARYDSVILQRKLLPTWQLAILRRSARHLIFDFDDAVLFRDSYDSRGPSCSWRERRFAATVQAADAVVAGNDFLADCALRAGALAERVHLIPTCVEPRNYPLTEGSLRKNSTAESVDLVWIGSSSTLRGLVQKRDLWERLGREIRGLRLRVICDRYPDLWQIPIIPVPWTVESEARELAAGQIGISWMPDDLWSRGKCGLKVLQYQAAGLPVVANPVGLHIELIEPSVTGFLPTTENQWVECVQTLAADPLRRLKMGRLARQRVETGFSTEAWAGSFVAAICGVDKPALGEMNRIRNPGQRSIPDPFFVRMRRMGIFERTAHVGHLERNGDSD